MALVLKSLIMITLLNVVLSFPLFNNKKTDSEMESAASYLKNYGFFVDNSCGDKCKGIAITSRLHQQNDQLSAAFKRFQKMYHLPETGYADDETIKLMKKPRCGRPDVENKQNGGRSKRYTTTDYIWSHRSLSYRLQNYTLDIARSSQDAAIQRAFNAWESNSDLTFNKVSTLSDIEVSFEVNNHEDPYPFDGKGNVLAHAFFPQPIQLGGDIHLDDAEDWTNEGELAQVIAHEIGHSVGLDHSNEVNSIMYAYITYNSNWVLTSDDINGVNKLYPPKTTTPTRPTTTTKATTPTTKATTTTTKPTTTTTKPTTTTTATTTTTKATTTTTKPTTTKPTTTTTKPTTTTTKPTTTTTKPTTTTTKPTTTTTKPTTTTTKATTTQKPTTTLPPFSLCDDGGKIDAITADQTGNIHVFKGLYYASLNVIGSISSGYARLITNVFIMLPSKVDAILYLPVHKKRTCITFAGGFKYCYGAEKVVESARVYIFSGEYYYLFLNGALTSVSYSSSGKITSKFPGMPSTVDSAFTTDGNVIQFTKGNSLYKINRDGKKYGNGSPTTLSSTYQGLPTTGVDATYKDYYTNTRYFFKGSNYYTVSGSIANSYTGVGKKMFGCIV